MGSISQEMLKLRPVTFEHRGDESDARQVQFGLIAEEVAELLPELVRNDAEGQPVTVQYHILAPMIETARWVRVSG